MLRVRRRGDAGGEFGVGPLEPSFLIHDQDGYRQPFHGVVRHRLDMADHVAEVGVEVAHTFQVSFPHEKGEAQEQYQCARAQKTVER